MDSKVKQQVKGRVLTLISKIEELQQIETEHYNNGLDSLPNLEGWNQDLMRYYSELLSN